MVVFSILSMSITPFTIQQMTTFGVYLADLGPGVGAGLGTVIFTGQYLYQRYKASGPQRQAPYRKTCPDAPPPPPSTISRQRVNADQPLLINELDKGGFGPEKVCSKCDLEDIEVSEASRDSIEQELFAGFSFINPKMADLLIDESCPGVESDVKHSKSEASNGPQLQAPYRKTCPDAPPPPPSTISRQRVNADQPLLINELDKGGFGPEKVCSKCDLEDIEVSEASRDSIEQELFAGFSFINPKMADLLIDESCPGVEPEAKHSKSDSSSAYNDLVLTNELGKGGFGTVYLADFKQQRGEYFAVKVLEKQEALEQKCLVETEMRVLNLAKDNPFLVHLYSTHEDKEHLYFIMEFISGGSLRSLIQDGPLDLARSRFYSAEIIVGLQFLHRNGVIHRDLKPDNVMIDKDGHIKIIDFGLCGFMEHEKLTTSHCGTLPYMSPEALLSDPYSFSTDWWSFGVLLHELLTSQRPYDGDDVIMLMDNIVSMVHLCSITEEADDLLDKLWAFDPSFRLGEVGNIRDHPFYDTLSWSALEQRAMDPPKVEQDSSKCDLEDFKDSEASKDSVHQEQFVGFSYINPKMADLLIDESCPGSECDVKHSKSDSSSSDNNDLVLINELGKGGFGTVYLAEFKRKRGEYFAVKVLVKQEVLQKNCLKYTMVERRVLTLTLDNPFLAHLYFSYQDQEHLYFIMEFISGGSLRSLIQDGPLDLARSRFYSAEIIVGLQFLHRNGVIHRDLKPDNVMIDKDGHIKIIDFGLCGFMEHEKLTTSHCGTLPYMSPEALLSDPYSFSTDWWSFGVLLHELLTSQRPYDGDDVIMLMDNIVSMVHLCSITEEADDLLEKLWAFDPSFRLGEVGNIRDHPFYDTLSWSALEQRAMDPPKVEQDSSKRDLEDFEDSKSPPVKSKESKDSVDQEQFPGFSYNDPKMADLLIDESCGVEPDVSGSKSETGISPWLWLGAAVLTTGFLFVWLR